MRNQNEIQIFRDRSAEGFPAMYCGCAACEAVRREGGTFLRVEFGAKKT